MRVGIGYDIHPLVHGRKLILGGVVIPFMRGLEGHSDGDVLVHSICDALFGAAAKEDIGRHFPSNQEYKGVSSIALLKKTMDILSKMRYKVNNVDATIIAESPKLEKLIEGMRENISKALGINKSNVSVKATTAKGLGTMGRGMAITSIAVATIKESSGFPPAGSAVRILTQGSTRLNRVKASARVPGSKPKKLKKKR